MVGVPQLASYRVFIAGASHTNEAHASYCINSVQPSDTETEQSIASRSITLYLHGAPYIDILL